MIFPKIERTLEGRYCIYNGYTERFCSILTLPFIWTLITVRAIR